jgi:membrane fusion protein (multidrug efflux system)
MNRTDHKARLLRFLWGIFPWLMVFLVLAFILIMTGLIKEENSRLEEAKKASLKKDIQPVRVITLTLEPRRLEDKINLPAAVEAYEDLEVKAEVPGQVIKVLVDEGQIVKKGQIIVHLDDRDYETRLARVEANYRLAKLDYDRNVSLAKKQVTSIATVDSLEARLKDLEAQLDEARLSLSRTKIVAPINGKVNEIKSKQGDFLSVGDPVAQIIQFDKVKVKVGVPESDVAAIFDLDKADVIIDALGKRMVQGRKVFLSSQPQSLSRLYDLELEVPNPDGHILPGMFARVDLVKQVFSQALAVPLYAVIARGEERFVFIEENGQAKMRNINLGMITGWQVQITAGLQAGDKVIVVGHRLLSDGQTVDVIKNVSDAKEIL